jgi:hypothetical protein
MDINILVKPVYKRQRAQLTDISNPDINHTLYMPMSIYTPGHESLYASMPSLDKLIDSKPTTNNWNAYW